MPKENVLEGLTIRRVRPMNKKELDKEGWHGHATVIELSDGTKLYASRDDEGNGPGAMFGLDPHNQGFAI